MTEVIQKNNYFLSSDISLCSALCCLGYQIKEIDKTNPSRVVFCIKKDAGIEEAIKDYFAHQLKVDPLSFFNFLKENKTRIYHT